MNNQALEVARAAVLEIAEADALGDFLNVEEIDGFRVFRFASTHAGYVDWRWSCSLSSDADTVNEVWLEPGPDSLLAKPWTPWSERIQPGDMAPGDVVPTQADDDRLAPGYTEIPETELIEPLSPTYWEIGLGRERVLSKTGVDEATYRWRDGDHGPRTPFARYADLPCGSCAWMLTIGGRVGQAFGVCANPISPSDGRVVTMDHGCGAHSESVVEAGVLPVTELVIDDLGYDYVSREELQALATDSDEVSAEEEAIDSAENEGLAVEDSDPEIELEATVEDVEKPADEESEPAG
jgi:hypothetical protein